MPNACGRTEKRPAGTQGHRAGSSGAGIRVQPVEDRSSPWRGQRGEFDRSACSACSDALPAPARSPRSAPTGPQSGTGDPHNTGDGSLIRVSPPAIVATLSIGVQNHVPFAVVGVATSALQFYRSVGGVFGLAVLGVVLATRFSSSLQAAVPEAVQAVLADGQFEDRLRSAAPVSRVSTGPRRTGPASDRTDTRPAASRDCRSAPDRRRP